MVSAQQSAGFREVRAPRDAHQLGLTFSGSGAEYFRIWIVNLLLILLTLGLYLPWAKVRKLRYFYNHTDVGGYALDFHGKPWRMLRGTLFMGAFLLVYSNAARFAPLAGLVATVMFVAVWPALVRASMQFRLANTSWRGMRFAFRGDVAGAYRALALPMALALLPFAWLGTSAAQDPRSALANVAWAGAAFAVFVVSAPFFYWLFKRYQHGGYSYASLRVELRAGVGSVYGVFLRSLGLVLLCALGIGLLYTLLVLGAKGSGSSNAKAFGAFAAGIALALSSYFIVVVLIRSYWGSRAQNLIWSRTGNRVLRFRSSLSFRRLLGLTVKNWLLMALTLGLYWPFAAVAVYRLRVEAITLVSRVAMDELASAVQRYRDDATGDMAADLMGLDFGM